MLRVCAEVGEGLELSLEVGKVATLASGAVLARLGGTTTLATAVSSRFPNTNASFLPLSIEYREKSFASGLIPTTFTRRDMWSEREVLGARAIDRTLRPLFPAGYPCDTQIIATVLSYDDINDPVALSITAASAALSVSDIPWNGPVAAVNVGWMDGKPVINPDLSASASSSLNLLYAGTATDTLMLEADANSIPEKDLIEAMMAGQEALPPLINVQHELIAGAGKDKRVVDLVVPPEEVVAAAYDAIRGPIGETFTNCTLSKSERGKASDEIRTAAGEQLEATFPDVEPTLIGVATTTASKMSLRANILDAALTADETLTADMEPASDPDLADLFPSSSSSSTSAEYDLAYTPVGARADSRASTQLRNIDLDVDILPRVHGSSLFGRGSTQSLCTSTLGPPRIAQLWRDVAGQSRKKNFFLHYDFPPYCINETGRVGGFNRRMIGHGALAEKALTPVMPDPTDYPLIVRVTSEVTGSDGSSSMATVCGASLALMDAGVPVSEHVAGISVGLVTPRGGLEPGGTYVLLTDILGLEDFSGDMDFKVAGTRSGVTALQLDIKLPGVPIEVLGRALGRAKVDRCKLLDMMDGVIAVPRPVTKPDARLSVVMEFEDANKGGVIGPGGTNLRRIEEDTGATLDLSLSGQAVVFAPSAESLEAAVAEMESAAAGILGGSMRHEVEVPDTMKGRIIGSKGVTIKAIEAETKCHVNLDSPGIAILSAHNQDALDAAAAMIDDILNPAAPDFSAEVDIPSRMKGRVIGKQGSTIRSIQDTSGANVNLNSEGTAVVTGDSQEAVDKACELIAEILEAHSDSNNNSNNNNSSNNNKRHHKRNNNSNSNKKQA